MSSVINIVVTERQWEELKGLLGTANQSPVSICETFYPPLKCMITSLRLERVGSNQSYHVQLILGKPPESGEDGPVLLTRWPNWLENCTVDTADQLTLGPNPSAAIARLFI